MIYSSNSQPFFKNKKKKKDNTLCLRIVNVFNYNDVVTIPKRRKEDCFMFYHKKELQYHSKPERPDPIMARKLQEILGG